MMGNELKNRSGRCAEKQGAIVSLAVIIIATTTFAQAPKDPWLFLGSKDIIDDPIYEDPLLPPQPSIKVYDMTLISLWRENLDHPQTEVRRRVAREISLAHTGGMPDLQSMRGKLAELMLTPGEHPVAILAYAQALIVLGARDHAEDLRRTAQTTDLKLQLELDKALAKWRYESIYDEWRRRIDFTQTVHRTLRISAIQSLATVKDNLSAQTLLGIAMSQETDIAMQVAAAKAVGAITQDALEDTSRTLLDPGLPIHRRLVGVHILATHSSKPAVALLLKYAIDPEPAVAGAALKRLLEIDPLLIEPIAPGLLNSADANVRMRTAQAVIAQATPRAVDLLAQLLADPDPAIRVYVRQQLLLFAARDTALDKAVRKIAVDAIHGDIWRSQEQAAFIIGKLDHEQAAGRLLELIDVVQPEVRIAASVALRWMAIPETLPPLLTFMERTSSFWLGEFTAAASSGDIAKWPKSKKEWFNRHRAGMDKQIGQIMMMFAQMRFAESERIMHQYIPKHSGFAPYSRAGAIYAMGYFHEGKPDKNLVAHFRSRLSDITPLDPERRDVRRLSAIGLGRMKARQGLGTLKQFLGMEKNNAPIFGACRWAIMQITGKDLPPIKLRESRRSGGFLTRHADRKSDTAGTDADDEAPIANDGKSKINPDWRPRRQREREDPPNTSDESATPPPNTD